MSTSSVIGLVLLAMIAGVGLYHIASCAGWIAILVPASFGQ